MKAGKCVAKSDKKPTGLLHLTSHWVLLSDLCNNYVFPGHIAISALRPDIVLFSNALMMRLHSLVQRQTKDPVESPTPCWVAEPAVS